MGDAWPQNEMHRPEHGSHDLHTIGSLTVVRFTMVRAPGVMAIEFLSKIPWQHMPTNVVLFCKFVSNASRDVGVLSHCIFL